MISLGFNSRFRDTYITYRPYRSVFQHSREGVSATIYAMISLPHEPDAPMLTVGDSVLIDEIVEMVVDWVEKDTSLDIQKSTRDEHVISYQARIFLIDPLMAAARLEVQHRTAESWRAIKRHLDEHEGA